MILFLTLATSFGQAAQAPIALKHTFVKGMKSEYRVEAVLQNEVRERGLNTFLPEDQRFAYSFYTNTLDVVHDIATVRYSRPTIAETGSATPDSDPKTVVTKLNLLEELQISPINEVLDDKDLTPKKKPKPAESLMRTVTAGRHRQVEITDLIAPFVGDLERLSVWISGPGASLDLEPRFDLGEVKVGDSWKRTVSYQPQALSSKSGKVAVQRLDLTYSYKGLVESNGKKVQRVHAEINFDSDFGPYVSGLFGLKPDQIGLKSIPTNMALKMDFDLDPKSMQTVFATLKSEGGFKIFAANVPDAVLEQNIHGSSEMRLVSNKIVLVTPPKK